MIEILAEIHGKISSLGTNLSEQMEDNLTGNLFGTLRYLLFEHGLGSLLSRAVQPRSFAVQLSSVHYRPATGHSS
ncbi:MAG: hypothetical protein ABS949_09905 [Solibacillus sp.]